MKIIKIQTWKSQFGGTDLIYIGRYNNHTDISTADSISVQQEYESGFNPDDPLFQAYQTQHNTDTNSVTVVFVSRIYRAINQTHYDRAVAAGISGDGSGIAAIAPPVGDLERFSPFELPAQDSGSTPEPALTFFWLVTAQPVPPVLNPTWNATTEQWDNLGAWTATIPDFSATTASDRVFYAVRQGGANSDPIEVNPNFLLYSAAADGANPSATQTDAHNYWGTIGANGQVSHWNPIGTGELTNYFDLRIRVDSADLDVRRAFSVNMDLDDYDWIEVSFELFPDGTATVATAARTFLIPTDKIVLVDFVSGIASNRQYQWTVAIGEEHASIKRGGDNPTFGTVAGTQGWVRMQLTRANGDTDDSSRIMANVVFESRSVQPNPNIRVRISGRKGQ